MKKNALEWVVFFVSLALTGALLVYLGITAATSSDRPPRLDVTLGPVEPVPGGYSVQLDASNSGDTTAANVVIEVVDRSRIRAEVMLPFVPHGSSRRAWVTFPDQPATGELRARVLGYEAP